MKKIIVTACAFVAILSCQNQTKQVDGHVHFANKTDYICGMEVQSDWTDTCSYKGQTYAFCSTSCKEEFLKNPDQYLRGQ